MVHQWHHKNVKLTSDKKKDVTANPFPSILIISVKCPPDCHRMMLPSSSDDTIRPPCASSSQMAVLCEVSVSCSLTAVPRGGMSNTMIPPSEVPKITNLVGVTNLSKHTYVDRELHVHHHMWVKIFKGRALLKHWLRGEHLCMRTLLICQHPCMRDTLWRQTLHVRADRQLCQGLNNMKTITNFILSLPDYITDT